MNARFAEFVKRYLTECKTSVLAFLLSFLLLIPILTWQYQAYVVFVLPVAVIFAMPNIAVFGAVIALGQSIALRIFTLMVAIVLNVYILQQALFSRIDHFEADGDVLVTNQNTFPVIFWQLFLSFAVFYALLSYRRLADERARYWAAMENG